MNKAVAVLTGMGIGGGLMFMLDPDRGGRRREFVKDKAVGAWNTSQAGITGAARGISRGAKAVAGTGTSVFRRGQQQMQRQADEARFALWRQRWPTAWRVGMGAAGGALAYYGMRHRGILGTAASAAGITMLTRGASNREVTKLFGLIGRAAA